MAFPAKKARYTFADVLEWDENERIEIVEGEAVMMAPPTRSHQKVSGEIFRQLANYLEGKNARSITLLLASGSLNRTGTARRMWIRWSNRTFQ